MIPINFVIGTKLSTKYDFDLFIKTSIQSKPIHHMFDIYDYSNSNEDIGYVTITTYGGYTSFGISKKKEIARFFGIMASTGLKVGSYNIHKKGGVKDSLGYYVESIRINDSFTSIGGYFQLGAYFDINDFIINLSYDACVNARTNGGATLVHQASLSFEF